MICRKCGNEVEDGAIICPHCSTLIAQSNSYIYSQLSDQGRQEVASARTLGIVSIIAGIFGFALVSWICGGIGLSKAKSWLFTNDTSLLYDARKAKKLNVAGIIVGTVMFVLLVVINTVVSAGFAYALFSGM